MRETNNESMLSTVPATDWLHSSGISDHVFLMDFGTTTNSWCQSFPAKSSQVAEAQTMSFKPAESAWDGVPVISNKNL